MNRFLISSLLLTCMMTLGLAEPQETFPFQILVQVPDNPIAIFRNESKQQWTGTFVMDVEMKNISDKPQHFIESGCGWEDNWSTNLASLSLPNPTCLMNVKVPIDLNPGESQRHQLTVNVAQDKPEPITFQVAFRTWKPTTIDGAQSTPIFHWSDPVTVTTRARPAVLRWYFAFQADKSIRNSILWVIGILFIVNLLVMGVLFGWRYWQNKTA